MALKYHRYGHCRKAAVRGSLRFDGAQLPLYLTLREKLDRFYRSGRERRRKMTMHEALAFVRDLHGWIAAHSKRRGQACWPTREELAQNLRHNRALFPERSVDSTFRYQMREAARKGWLEQRPCVAACHVRHVRLTAGGLERLALMDEHGCSGIRCKQGDRHALPSMRFVAVAA